MPTAYEQPTPCTTVQHVALTYDPRYVDPNPRRARTCSSAGSSPGTRTARSTFSRSYSTRHVRGVDCHRVGDRGWPGRGRPQAGQLMGAPAPMAGFTVEDARAWWVTCGYCGDSEMVYGEMADVDASTWASAHVRECEVTEETRRRNG